jgi:hypothetical protein
VSTEAYTPSVDTTYDARSKRIFFAMVDGSDPEIGHIYFDEHHNSLAMLSGSSRNRLVRDSAFLAKDSLARVLPRHWRMPRALSWLEGILFDVLANAKKPNAEQPPKCSFWRMAALPGLRRLFRSWMKSRRIADVVLGPSPLVLGRWPKRSASRRKNGRKCYAMMVDRCEAPEGYCQVFESRVRITAEHYVRPDDKFSDASIIVSAIMPKAVTHA